MTGTVWDQLRDFQLATGDYHILRDPRVVMLDGYNRYLFHTIFANNGEKSVQGGDEINFSMMFDVGNTYSHPLPAEFRQWKRVEGVYEAKQRWAKSSDHKTWLRDEILRNKQKGGSWFDVLFDMDRKLEQRLRVSLDKGLEDDMGAVPHYDNMENRTLGANASILPYSLFAHINEDALGLFGKYSTGSGLGDNSQISLSKFTVKQQFAMTTAANLALINADYNVSENGGGSDTDHYAYATSSKYSPVQTRYGVTTVDNTDNIFSRLRQAYRKCQWEGPSSTRQWYEDSTMNNFRCVTSELGIRVLETMIKEGQDRWLLGPQDFGIPDVQLYGIPIRWWPKLDTIELYDNGVSSSAPSSKKDELNGDNTGPRIYGFNFNKLYPVVHEGMWMYREAMPPHFNVPDVFVEYIECWWNLVCEDYRQHFVVSPKDHVYTA